MQIGKTKNTIIKISVGAKYLYGVEFFPILCNEIPSSITFFVKNGAKLMLGPSINHNTKNVIYDLSYWPAASRYSCQLASIVSTSMSPSRYLTRSFVIDVITSDALGRPMYSLITVQLLSEYSA